MAAFRSQLALHLIQDSTTQNHVENLHIATLTEERRGGGRGRGGTLGRGPQGTASLAAARGTAAQQGVRPLLTPATQSEQL